MSTHTKTTMSSTTVTAVSSTATTVSTSVSLESHLEETVPSDRKDSDTVQHEQSKTHEYSSSATSTIVRSYDWSMSRFWPFPRLPQHRGPYPVGCHDIEWYGGSGRSEQEGTSNITTTHPEDEQIEREAERHPMLVRLYYPAQPTGKETRPSWLPDPFHVYGQGKYEM
jgi:hypothetical protein